MQRLFMDSIALLCLMLLMFNPAWSKDGSDTDDSHILTSGTPLVSTDTLNARIKKAENSTTLDDAGRAALIELLNNALSSIEKVRANLAGTQAFIEIRETSPHQVKAIRTRLKKAKDEPEEISVPVNENSSFEKIEQALLQEKANLVAVEAKRADLANQLEEDRTRPAVIPELLADAKQTREQLESDKKTPASPGQLAWVTEARQWSQATHIAELRSDINLLDQELLTLPFKINLLEAQRDQLDFTIKRIKARSALLEDLASKKGRVEAREAMEAADAAVDDAADKHPLVQQLAAENAELTRDITEKAFLLKRSSASDEVVEKDAKRIEIEYRHAREQLEVAGLSEVLGEVLGRQRQALPEKGTIRRKLARLEDESAAISLRIILLNSELEKLRDNDDVIAELTSGLDSQTIKLISADLLALTDTQHDLLEKSANLDKSYLRTLTELTTSYRHLLDTSASYNDFLGKNLLWIRSASPPSLKTLSTLPAQLARLFSPSRWRDLPAAIFAGVTTSFPVAVLLVIFIGLVWKRRYLRKRLIEMGELVGRPAEDKFSFTLKALGITLLLAITWPLLTVLTGWALVAGSNVSDFSGQVSDALLTMSPTFLYVQIFSMLCVQGGVADRHFRWPSGLPKSLLLYFSSLKVVLLPLIFVLILSVNDDHVIDLDTVERTTMIFALLVIALFFYRISKLLIKHSVLTMRRQRYFWLGLTVAAPLVLAVLAFIGFFYTAGTLGAGLLQTLWIVFGLVVLHQVVVRWLLVTQRRLALRAARERRQVEREEKEVDAETEGVQLQVEEPEVDLIALSDESRKLISMMLVIFGFFGLWYVWSDILQAFNILDEVSLWHKPAVVDGSEMLVPVSLGDLLIALLIAFLTYMAMKRLPPLFEILLLQHVGMTSGSRYTAKTLTTYTIVAVGVIAFFNIIGMDWSRVQWLFAALSVGIGFGLQEIVANFISGLIILFERPIRVGDVVTVGDTEGAVSRIQIRATTIRTWDGQELLVPNKEFITGRLLNWSLSDQVTRIKVPVGIAYGSDVQLAMKLMDDAAKQNDTILTDPAPYVVFNGFGDNALQLELRCYVGVQSHRIPAATNLYEEVNRQFNKAGIDISFPQRDVHLDASKPLDVRIHRDDLPGTE